MKGPTPPAVCAAAVVLAIAPAARAQTERVLPESSPTDLSGLTVAVPRVPPSVTATYPALDAKIAPGVLVLKVTFDQSMEAEAWSFAKGEAGDYPDCLTKPTLLPDKKTFLLLCSANAGRSYDVKLNSTGKGFISLGRRMAAPFEMRFTTTKDDPIRTLKDARVAAGLREDQNPIETTQAASRSEPSVGVPTDDR